MTQDKWQWMDADETEQPTLALGAIFTKERMIATVWKSSHADIAGAMQNAQLIVQAPEMLAFLLAVRDRYNTDDRMGGLGDWCIDLINKSTATGRQP